MSTIKILRQSLLIFLYQCGFSVGHLNAQTQLKTSAKIHYEFVHQDDTLQPENPYIEDLVVLLTANASLQKSSSVQTIKNYFHDFIYNPSSRQEGPNGIILQVPTFDKDISPFEYYLSAKDREHYMLTHIFDTYYKIEEEFPTIDWKIENDERQIGGYPCQLAVGSWKGRVYHAWFTSEIPFPYGPWKLQGLPGLILEAYDDKNQIKWTYAGFDTAIDDKSDQYIISPDFAVRTQMKKFIQLREAAAKNPRTAMMTAQKAAKANGLFGLDMTNSALTDYTLGVKKKTGYIPKTINNPLELLP